MHRDRLTIYLNDHLAVLVGEIELAKRCHAANRTGPLAEFLDRLAADLKDQQEILRDVLGRAGGSESRLKQGVAWLAEKAGRLKLNDAVIAYSSLTRVWELEALALAALERVFLWETLNGLRESDPRFAGLSFAHLGEQSRQHLDHLTARRQFAAAHAFRDWTAAESE